jgi:hypothetical protein
MAANEQAANPMNRKTDPNAMSESWLRSIARSWFSNCPPPEHRQDTRLDVGDGARRFDLGQDALARSTMPSGLWAIRARAKLPYCAPIPYPNPCKCGFENETHILSFSWT